MPRTAKAKDIMETEVITLNPETKLVDAWASFFSNQISGAPVVDDQGLMLGVVSQSDLLREAFASRAGGKRPANYFLGAPFWDYEISDQDRAKLEQLCVRDVMNPDVIQVSPDDDVALLAVTMRHNRIHRLVVTDQSRVVGMISALDLLQLLENH